MNPLIVGGERGGEKGRSRGRGKERSQPRTPYFGKKKNKKYFRHMKDEKSHQHQIDTMRTVKGSPSIKRKIIPDRNVDLHKELKSMFSDYNGLKYQ